jgi:hypothetical protein
MLDGPSMTEVTAVILDCCETVQFMPEDKRMQRSGILFSVETEPAHCLHLPQEDVGRGAQ